MYVVSAFRRTSREVRLKPDTTYNMEPQSALALFPTPYSLWCHSLQELRRPNERDQQFLESESRLPERGRHAPNGLAVGHGLHAAKRVPKQLFDDALLARAAVGDQTADRSRLGECRIRQAGNLAFPVDRQLDGLGGGPSPRTGDLELDRFLVSPAADRVVVFQAEADRIHQPVTARAGRVLDVRLHPLPPRERTFV